MGKEQRAKEVLKELIELYLIEGKAVGSSTIKESAFQNLSSATIRNYLAKLEEEGYLLQEHSSAGRVPTSKGLRFYLDSLIKEESDSKGANWRSSQPEEVIDRDHDTHAVVAFLERCAEQLSEDASAAIFLSAPRFDHDFITEIKLLSIDSQRILAVVITDFGLIQTEHLKTPQKLSNFSLKRIENYFQFRLHNTPLSHSLSIEEEELAQTYYNELLVRYLVSYTHYTQPQLTCCGFKELAEKARFNDVAALLNSLSLFEDKRCLHRLIERSIRTEKICSWVGAEMTELGFPKANCTVLVMPYTIGSQTVGAIGMMGPMCMNYRFNLHLLYRSAATISTALTRCVYKHKITFRQPEEGVYNLASSEQKLLAAIPHKLLEHHKERL